MICVLASQEKLYTQTTFGYNSQLIMSHVQINVFNRYYYQDLTKLVRRLSNGEKTLRIEREYDFPSIKTKNVSYFAIVNSIGTFADIQTFFSRLYTLCKANTKIIITYYNYLWEPLLMVVQMLGLAQRSPQQNWLRLNDLQNLLYLSAFTVVKKGQQMLFPLSIPILSEFINRFIAPLPLVNRFCLTSYLVVRKKQSHQLTKSYSVSVVVAARNEEGNIETLVRKLPRMGSFMEIIFVEGHSKDNTWGEICAVQKKYKKKNIRAFRQKGIGKADAVHQGIKKARGDIIIILDADLTVLPSDMPKFYEALSSGKGEFINGSRLVYPLEKDSMRFLNKLGNALFSRLFSWTLNQRFTDTLCGTKAFFRKDYHKILALRKVFGDFDPFGDFELIFGAAKLNLHVLEIPVCYKARVYGSSNISRFTHGFLLLKMWLRALAQFKLT